MIIKIAQQINIKTEQVEAVLELLKADATLPFIARYRKEKTGGLDEVQIASIRDIAEQITSFNQRKDSIYKSLDEQGILTEELKKKLDSITDKSELEDFYLPYKPKRKTKASVAKERGLEGLAKMMMSQSNDDIEYSAKRFINSNVKDTEEALQGARDIIAEWISEDPLIRRRLRYLFQREGEIISKLVKGKEEEGDRFSMYFDYRERVKQAASHRILAIYRGENEGFIKFKIEPPIENAIELIESQYIRRSSTTRNHLLLCIKDAYKRLLQPSLQTEFKNELKEKADLDSIAIFAKNLKELLLAPPLKNKRVLSIDPGFRSGCKVVCLNENGDLLHNETIFPHPPQKDSKLAAHKITSLTDAYKIDVIAIGNGTAGKETDSFVRRLHFNKEIKAIMVNESGASVYSASKVAREEFPEYDVTVRGAVSIGRRLIDPLSELVKIDPKSIGVGQYQHDVDQNKLTQSLDEVVMSCVNAVGVDLNTASKQLLAYVSGIGPSLAENIVKYRKENGNFTNRKQILEVARLGQKAFEQSAGFLKINDGDNPLDTSSVHPESYAIVHKIAKDLNLKLEDLMGSEKVLEELDLEKYISNTIGLPTLKDIKKELLKPGLDPRKEYDAWEFDPNINRPSDLHGGMKLRGIVTNITAFGAFVDIGVHQDGLVHKSNMANEFVKDPNQFVHIGQKLMVTVIEVDLLRKRIQLSMK
ncbi:MULTISPECIES: Tex family protein [unclassified Lentimicrobium]|uniref:Tex family protein n=1 Tax=unclassified Lentimicrobium TaxID=2677434 RepID=UPI001556F013|nr:MULTISPECIES: Tex family protein [unclassified Lentimicrobium]NPD44334.1 RNA-binding transcriptional accessory protein [Lentimicrobium sp. S6]NPD86898.1 RNA-binding transcriptional accessory protein [Lentimicrobium sp. L6]